MRTEVLSFQKNTPPKISSALIAVIITALLNAGFILMLGTSFELEFPVFPAVLFAVIASSVFTAVHYPGIKKLSAGAFIAAPALTLLFVLFNWFHVKEGLLALLYNLQLYDFYWLPGDYPVPEDEGGFIFAFLVAYIFVSSCFTTFFLLKRRFIPAGLLFYLPLFIFSVANIIMLPDTMPCIVAGTGVMMLLLCHAFRNKKRTPAEKALLILIVPTFVFALLIGVIFPQKNYKKDEIAKSILAGIQESLEGNGPLSEILDRALNGFKNPNADNTYDIFSPLFTSSTNLSRVGPFNPPEEEQILRVKRVDEPYYSGPFSPGNTLYLKVESFDIYKDNNLSSSRIDYKVYNDIDSVDYEMPAFTVSITPLNDSNLDVVPYYTDFYFLTDSNNSPVNAYNFTRGNVSYFAASPLPVKSGNIYTDRYLDEYVYGVALKVPVSTRNALLTSGDLPDWYKDVYYGHLEMSDAEKVRRVTEFVTGLHPYDQNTPVPPKDVDFVPWFVSEAPSGICVHYAITTVILLRMIGVPARYVRGYVDTNSHNNVENTIYASRAHAWFEFFVPEYGWIMGDSTPGYSEDARRFNIDGLSRVYPEIESAEFSYENYVNNRVTETELESETDTSETDTSETDIAETNTPETTGTPDSSGEPEKTTSPEESAPEVSSDRLSYTYDPDAGVNINSDNNTEPENHFNEIELRFFKVIAGILISVISVFLLIVISRVVYVIYWDNRFKEEKINAKAVAYYHYYSFMGRMLRFTVPKTACDIAEKAVFSGSDISSKELNMLLTTCKEHMESCSLSYSRIKMSLYKLLYIKIRNYR